MEGKKIGQIKGQISRRRLVLNPTIQQVVINLHTKYEHSSLHTVRNFRNSISENKPLFEILGNILKLFLAIVFGVLIFRVFEVSGKLP